MFLVGFKSSKLIRLSIRRKTQVPGKAGLPASIIFKKHI